MSMVFLPFLLMDILL